jgi:hypothetical protein
VTGALEAACRGDEAAFERLVGPYRRELEEAGAHVPFALDVLTLDGEKISDITAFVVRPADRPDGYARWPRIAADPGRVESVFRRFGLPDRLS